MADTVGAPPPWRSQEFFDKYSIDVPVRVRFISAGDDMLSVGI